MFRRALFSGLALAVLLVSSPGYTAGEKGEARAIFAGGCFWCVESDFDKVPGVRATTSGYIGGSTEKPTYNQVSAGGTGHLEAVEIVYDPKKVSYDRLLHIFWRSVDPTDGSGQFCDRGESYKTAVFARNDAQRAAAEASRKALADSNVLGAPIATEIRKAGTFTPAEDYHQDYYKKNPYRYKFYRFSCRRDARIKSLWGDQALAGIPHSE